MNKVLLVLAFTLLGICLHAQSGMNVYTGLSQTKNKSLDITPEGSSHKGYHIGIDARLNEGKMYFLFGGQYHSLNFDASPDSKFFTIDQKMNWLKLRVGLGFNVIEFNEKIALTAKTLGSINVITSYPSVEATYNTGTAGAILGLGLDCYAFTINAEYEKGFFNAVNKVPGTEFDFLTFSVGVKF